MCSLTGQPKDTGEVWGQWGLDRIHKRSTHEYRFTVGYANPGQSLVYYLCIC